MLSSSTCCFYVFHLPYVIDYCLISILVFVLLLFVVFFFSSTFIVVNLHLAFSFIKKSFIV